MDIFPGQKERGPFAFSSSSSSLVISSESANPPTRPVRTLWAMRGLHINPFGIVKRLPWNRKAATSFHAEEFMGRYGRHAGPHCRTPEPSWFAPSRSSSRAFGGFTHHIDPPPWPWRRPDPGILPGGGVFPVMTPGWCSPVRTSYSSIIQAMICGVVYTSGAGTSFVTPKVFPTART